MNKKHAFLLSFLITGLIASNIYLFSLISQENKLETVIVARVIDGDTFVLEDERQIRLTNINAPEKNSPYYNLSSDYLRKFENQTLNIKVSQLDRYSRTLAQVYLPTTNEYINLKIVEQGLATKFLVNDKEDSIFNKAESQAIESEKGIWIKSQYYNCFESTIDEKEEIIILKNLCQEINLQKWIITDESSKSYKFKDISINEGKTISLHSTNGIDDSSTVYWNFKTNIWNNDKDTLYLFDKEDKIVHYHSYGY